MGKVITIESKKQAENVYACSPESGQGPGVVLLHAWWGLNEFARKTADRLAGEGFYVLAPDYLKGGVAETIAQAQALRSRMDRAQSYALAKECVRHLLDQPAVTPKKIGVIGFSLGCGAALELARSMPEHVVAVVLFYGSGGGIFKTARANFMGHFAERDEFVPQAQVKSLERRLAASGGRVQFHTYPGTGHWFFEEDRADAYHASAAQQAWERTITFLRDGCR